MTIEHDARDAQETVSAEDIAGEIWDSVMPPGTMDRGEAVALVATALREAADAAYAAGKAEGAAEEREAFLAAIGEVRGVSLGDKLEGKITEAEARDLINSALSIVRAVIRARTEGGDSDG